MADDAQTVRSINWRDALSFTHLFRAFRIAVHPSKLVLAFTALLLIWAGGMLLDGAWALARQDRDVFETFFNTQVEHVNTVVAGAIALDAEQIVQGTLNFVIGEPYYLLTNHWFFFTLFAIWFLLVWSVFGGAISRIAAVHVARDEKISVRQALRFSINKLLSFALAPLIPLLILLVIGIIVAIGGLLLYIPYVGPIVLSILLVFALVAGLIMTLVLLGLAGGFNLMYPTIAVEGSDSFDAISRSFSYVFARPWRMLFYTLVAVIYGALTYMFVRFFIYLMLCLTHFFVGWWLKGQAETYWPVIWPPPDLESLTYTPRYEDLKWSEDFAGGMIAFWVHIVVALLGAYAISFYFSANTIIYYLMRREVDATELEDVYVEETEDEFGETAAPAGMAGGAATPAPATPATSAPSGGVTGTAGSADPGGEPPASKPYAASDVEAPSSAPAPTEMPLSPPPEEPPR